MKKRILLIGYNFYPEPTGIGKYSGEMMYWLSQQGYDCTALTGYPYYPHWQVQEPYTKSRFWFKTETETFASGGRLTICRCPMYVPSKPTGLKRILLDLSFLLSAFFKLLQLLPGKKFDCVIAVAPSFQFGLLGVLYKKLCSAKLVYHIQDLQIEAARDLQLIKSESGIKLLLKIEKYIFNNSDIISSISPGMTQRVSLKAGKEVLFFPNWTNVNQFYLIKDKASLRIAFGFNSTDKIVLYSGAIGEKQGLEMILFAAQALHGIKELKFVICGSGPYKQHLENLTKELHIQNILFLPLQPAEVFNRFLNTADIHLVIQKSNASDLVMPSKLTTVLAVGGLAIITADEGSSLHALVKEYDMGRLIKTENQQSLNEGIRQALFTDNTVVTHNARSYAENHLSIEAVMRDFETAIGI